ncbi:MAG: hypothetical protein ACFBSF_10910 [Leptolyngbyaceae cyanobacterium]
MQKLIQVGQKLNAFTVQFDEALLNEIRLSYKQEVHHTLITPQAKSILEGGVSRKELLQSGGEYFLVSYGKYPLLWLSSNTDKTYQIYRRFFDALKIEEHIKALVDYDKNLVIYCGFLVVGNQAPNPKWHVDYFPGANGYTLITPLFEIVPEHGNLLYKNDQGADSIYQYRLGEAILFGDHFLHSTEPYAPSDRIRVLVSMTFGTDKIKYWDILKKTVGGQSAYLVLPCGHLLGSCICSELLKATTTSLYIKLMLFNRENLINLTTLLFLWAHRPGLEKQP